MFDQLFSDINLPEGMPSRCGVAGIVVVILVFCCIVLRSTW
jgi:hypothetical protein